MIKKEVIHDGMTIRQHQLGYISIKMEHYLDDKQHENQRTLLAINIYVVIIDQVIWILDTGFNDRFNIGFIDSRLKSDFMEIINTYRNFKDVNIIMSHFHPDHCGGLVKYFDLISSMNWRIFYNQRKLNKEYYLNYPEIHQFLHGEFESYPFKMDLRRIKDFNILCEGGHTPDHSAILFSDVFIYPGDIMPTVYHIQHVPTGEKNANQDVFIKNRGIVKRFATEKKATLLLPHAPNNGFHQM